MKQFSRLLSVLTLSLLTTICACKKEATSNSGENDSTTELATQADDQSRFTATTDAVENDATIAMESTVSFSGQAINITPTICDATVLLDTSGATKKMTITYNGGSCLNGFTRNGAVVVTMTKGMYWNIAGAFVTVTYQDFKVTRVHDKKSFTINGTHIITNESGGLLRNLSTLHTITHNISSSNMSLTFDDNTQRTWQVAKRREFTYDNGIVLRITGNHAEGSSTDIAVWGSNRFGKPFTMTITKPLVIRQDCNFRLTSGTVKHEGWATATITFGLNSDGIPTACPGLNSYYYELIWTGLSGKAHSIIKPY